MLTLCMLGKVLMLFVSSVDFFKKRLINKNSFKNTIRLSNNLDPDEGPFKLILYVPSTIFQL